MRKKDSGVTKKQYYSILVGVMIFFMVFLGIVIGMNIKNTANMRAILTESVKSQLLSTSMAARSLIDPAAFIQYNDAWVEELPSYQETLGKLRALADSAGAKYIYALKEQDSQYVFVFDTDLEDKTIFVPYELEDVHKTAFQGRNASGIMNVSDAYGSFNTAAVPIWHKGKVIGIVSADIDDTYLKSSYATERRNRVLLISILLLTMGVSFVATLKMLRRIREMQDKLEFQAKYDNVTGLPNRQCLMDHLAALTAAKNSEPFALFFIDLDNFKKVNDNAGHDAGDELLKQIALYLDTALDNAQAFRPSAGKLNIAARVGGDEFIQVVSGVDTVEKAEAIAGQLLDGFKTANLSKHIEKFNVGLSIGVALYPTDTRNYHVLIKYADMAMYHAKHEGKNRFRVYADEMQGKPVKTN